MAPGPVFVAPLSLAVASRLEPPALSFVVRLPGFAVFGQLVPPLVWRKPFAVETGVYAVAIAEAEIQTEVDGGDLDLTAAYEEP